MLTEKNKKRIRHWYKTLQEQNPEFVIRSAQTALIAQIAKTIAGDINRKQRVLLAEAGTGTGKSLAYLLAAIPLARALNKKVVISTATVALQQQLIDSDIPLVHLAAHGEFQFCLAKGRQRYCCAHKLVAAISPEVGLTPKHADLAKRMAVALQQGKWDGDRDTWPAQIPWQIWQHVVVDGLSCSVQSARHRSCPFHKARKGLKKADVIVANHSLLLADLHAGSGHILPPAEDCIYILDEAHQFPDIAREASANQLGLRYALKELENIKELDKHLATVLNPSSIAGTSIKLKEACVELSRCFNKLKDIAIDNKAHFEQSGHWRFPLAKTPTAITNLASNYFKEANKLSSCLQHFAGVIQESVADNQLKSSQAEALLSQLSAMQHLSESWVDTLFSYANENNQKNTAFWFSQKEKELLLCSSPIEIGGVLQQLLWQDAFSVIAVSATLSALGNFSYYLNQVGLPKLPSEQLVKLPSPFNYQQVELQVPSRLPEPDHPDFARSVADYVLAAQQNKGGVLVLCNSYRLVDLVAEHLEKHNISNLWVQGKLTNQQLLAKHRDCRKQHQTSTILATIGFSEGIDLPGELLTDLLIARLPFAVPTEPVMASHAELLESRNQNPFMLLTLPSASRKLIQSCGRLMRKESDSGRIVLLDSRLSSRRYGSQLLAALPPYKRSDS
ncbi:ATP-dependent DNA helicase DinG [Agarivorans sp. Toyoura001]|uniref:ATP-dependent DNA helicase DinG n=1 Tax=Agarivorans sp. Toyoura001 TaxID=2283141 RepID=UPI0010D59120|nr:ATP-dependent DNA helicase DinG [Agarivorans sp. Toyoura001]GDY27516.1 ATP-dependent DNA helicase DinG [Agarivorans sp. Toyoura001]